MFNRERTKEKFGYDLDLSIRRRTRIEFIATKGIFRKDLKVVDNCPNCNKERYIKLRASRKNKLCYKCFHNSPKMKSIKRQPKPPISDETRKKMSDNHWLKDGKNESPFKNKKHSAEAKVILAKKAKQQNKDFIAKTGREEYSIRMACTARQIKREDWDGVFLTPINTKIRQSNKGKDWIQKVLHRDNYTCAISGSKQDLQVHHLESFSSNPSLRFSVDNGITLSKEVHSRFHSIYGKKNNTKQQFEEFKKKCKVDKKTLPTVYIVAGIAGSGKSWVCRQLEDKFHYVSYDSNRNKTHLDLLKATPKDKIALYDLNMKTSTFIRRHSHEFNIHFLVILGDFLQVKQQLKDRGGKITRGTYSRWEVMKRRAKKYAEFTGDSNEVLQYLKNI